MVPWLDLLRRIAYTTKLRPGLKYKKANPPRLWKTGDNVFSSCAVSHHVFGQQQKQEHILLQNLPAQVCSPTLVGKSRSAVTAPEMKLPMAKIVSRSLFPSSSSRKLNAVILDIMSNAERLETPHVNTRYRNVSTKEWKLLIEA
mmetsp:Transcript_30630/g.74636  ORF Transcript_30630/g.74636 Transcript_30630/m.74636 type:complete len:144 (+) Transcript_30630:429-860(+)